MRSQLTQVDIESTDDDLSALLLSKEMLLRKALQEDSGIGDAASLFRSSTPMGPKIIAGVLTQVILKCMK